MTITGKEIRSQYDALERTLAVFRTAAPAVADFFRGADRVLLLGCGSSYNLCHGGELALALWGGLDTLAMPGGDVLLHHADYAAWLPGARIVTVSRSGSTSEIVRTISLLKEKYGCEALAVTAVADSALSRVSTLCVEIPWAFDASVCQTRCVTNLHFSLMLIASIQAGRPLDGLDGDLVAGRRFITGIEDVAEALAALPWNKAFLLADGVLRGIAEEGAMALAEIANTQSNHYHLLDSRHGPMLLIDREALVVACVRPDEEGLTLHLLRHVASRGAHLCILSTAPIEVPGALVVQLDGCYDERTLGLPLINLIQLVALYRAQRDGLNPDAPEGLVACISL